MQFSISEITVRNELKKESRVGKTGRSSLFLLGRGSHGNKGPVNRRHSDRPTSSPRNPLAISLENAAKIIREKREREREVWGGAHSEKLLVGR